MHRIGPRLGVGAKGDEKMDKTVQKISEESNQQVVATVLGRSVTRGELAAAFSRVENKTNWKMPIDATVGLTDYERAEMAEAVVFFTGSVAEFEIVTGGQYRVKARGYYAAVGA